MKNMNKTQSAFKQAMRIIAKDLRLTPQQLNLWIRFDMNGYPTLIARHDSLNLKRLKIESLLKPKMIGARLGSEKLIHFFRCMHASFMVANGISNPTSVSLVLYTSEAVQEICVGFYLGQKAVKAYRLEQMAELTKTGNQITELN